MPADLVVRRLCEDDLDAVLGLVEEVAAEDRWLALEAPIDRERIRARFLSSLRDRSSLLLVAEIGGEVVGNLDAEARGGDAKLGMVVDTSWRRQGVGTALLEACLDWARQTEIRRLTLEVFPHNEAAIALYERFGFVREGYLPRRYRRRNGELWDAVVMELSVEKPRSR
jgi:RimJ/RimL family protein N-acetyltransferase